MYRREFLAAAGVIPWLPPLGQEAPAGWTRLATEPFRGKQDDVWFANERTGWYGNGAGKLYRTDDGGATWRLLFDRPGTFVRALGFVDETVGFLGNIGPGYFPNVSDEAPLYRTDDGGETWAPVDLGGGRLKGVCAIDIRTSPGGRAAETPFVVRAGGRVGGPAELVTSRDGGCAWSARDLSHLTGMILDIHFISDRVGFICGATDPVVEKSRALILGTWDGGETWSPVHIGERPWEITWKMSWPSEKVGYVTIQSYDRDPGASRRYVAKSTDGGETWREIPLVDDHGVRPFGVGFVDERFGWVGAAPHGFETADGGASWVPADMGAAVNKIRILPRGGGGHVAFAIGSELHRRDIPQKG